MAKVLILEDNLELALYWQRLLEAQNHGVQCCDTVAAALTLTEKMQPDLVIVDMLIKSGDTPLPQGGLTLVGKLKLLGTSCPPLLGVSGMKRSNYLKSTALEVAEKMGLDLALYKPISEEQLLRAVSYLLTLKPVPN
ncbi:MAG: response regulator [Cyanobacteria bacterium J06598_1]